ncbi:MAG: hypothetical protein JXJ18_09445 [Rhodobacteraceae bacterium]|nr:hypothetical protein [Paracoccaceae bacterium]
MRVMLFGDSHLAALKNGLAQVAVPDGVEVSFWGTPGNRFRNISWRDGQIVPDDARTAEAFARFGGQGLTRLDPADYDAVVFVGARIRPGAVLPDLLHCLAHPTRHLTPPYMGLVLAEHFLQHTTYQMACNMARDGKTRVLMNMISLETDGKSKKPRQYQIARGASHDHVALLWDITREILAQDDMTFIAQPLDTVVDGFYTDARYGVEGEDAVHKNADYGARILAEIFAALA